MPDEFVCGKCGKVAKTKQALERHAAYHEDERPFSCEVCEQRFKNSDDRGKHYRRLRRDGKFAIACKPCHKHFKTVELLNKHVEMLGCKVPTDESTASAADPAADFDASESNTVAMTTTAPVAVKEEPMPGDGISCTCKICETEFIGSSFLKAHYREVHKDTKKQVCIQCGQTLSSKDSLARHFSIFHQRSFPYSCDICNQKFKIKESLCRHVKFVHQNTGYPCTECQRVFTQPVNLKKHMAVHSSLKQYVCQVCGREFRWKQALQKHEALHTEKKGGEKMLVVDPKTGSARLESYTDKDDSFNDLNECGDQAFDGDNDIKCEALSPLNHNTEFQLEMCNESENDLIFGNSESNKKKQSTGAPDPDQIGTNYGDKRQNTSRKRNIGNEEVDNDNVMHKKNNDVEGKDRYDFESDDQDVFKDQNKDKNADKSREKLTKRKHNIKSKDLKLETVKKAKFSESGFSETLTDYDIEKEVFDSGTDDYDVLIDDDSHVRHLNDGVKNIKNGEKVENGKNVENVKIHSGVKETCHIQHVKDSDLTSCPTSSTMDVPRLVFKPSSIQSFMSTSKKQQPKAHNVDDADKFETHGVSKRDSGTGKLPTKNLMKLPERTHTLSQSLHNPFLIQDSRKSQNPRIASPVPSTLQKKYFVQIDLPVSINSDNKSPTTSIPSGKFSMVKHMLTLKNEDNFDKNVFENPLYNKLPEVKDLKLLVERHKITQKTDDCVVEQYDLSAKQNIPFHWLGMSVRKNEPRNFDITPGPAIDNSPTTSNDSATNDSNKATTIGKPAYSTGNTKTTSGNRDITDGNTTDMSAARGSDRVGAQSENSDNDDYIEDDDNQDKMYRTTSDTRLTKDNEEEPINELTKSDHKYNNSGDNERMKERMNKDWKQDPRGYQAIKSLVALKKRSGQEETLVKNSPSGSSVWVNPFVKHIPSTYSSTGYNLAATECANILKRSTAIFGAMTHIHNSDLERSSTSSKSSLNFNSRLQNEDDENDNTECNNDTDLSYNHPEPPSSKWSQFNDVPVPLPPSTFSVSTTDGLSDLHLSASTSASNSTHLSSTSRLTECDERFIHRDRSFSIPSSSTESVSSNVPRYGSDSIPANICRPSFSESNQASDFTKKSFEGVNFRTLDLEQRERMIGQMNNVKGFPNTPIIDHLKGVRPKTMWMDTDIRAAHSENDFSHQIHLSSMYSQKDLRHRQDRHNTEMFALNHNHNATYPGRKFVEENHHDFRTIPNSMPYAGSVSNSHIATNLSRSSSSVYSTSPHLFTSPEYTPLTHQISNKVAAHSSHMSMHTSTSTGLGIGLHNSNLSSKTPAHSASYSTSTSYSSTSDLSRKQSPKMSPYPCQPFQQNDDNDLYTPPILDFSYKRNDDRIPTHTSKTSNTNVSTAVDTSMLQSTVNIQATSSEHNDVSIFDILKGPSENKPKQLVNVDCLLDAYV